MNIKVISDRTPELDKITGGGYAVTDIKVHIAANMPLATKQEVVIHEIVECFNPSWPHSSVDKLTALLMDGLRQL